MDGPTQQTGGTENMSALSLKDLMIMKMFIEKANRSDLFLETEKPSVTIVYTKLSNLIKAVEKLQKQKLEEAKNK